MHGAMNRITVSPDVCGGRPCIRGFASASRTCSISWRPEQNARRDSGRLSPTSNPTTSPRRWSSPRAQSNHPILRSASSALSGRRATPPCARSAYRSSGHSAKHVADCGLSTAADTAIRSCCRRRCRRPSRRTRTSPSATLCRKARPSVFRVRLGNTRRVELLRRMEANLPAIVAALERGDTLREESRDPTC